MSGFLWCWRGGRGGPTSNPAIGGGALTGLDWNGNPSARRAIVFSGVVAAGLSAYPATYLWKVYQRNQVSGIGDGTRYYTTSSGVTTARSTGAPDTIARITASIRTPRR